MVGIMHRILLDCDSTSHN